MPKTIRDVLKGSIATAYVDLERCLTQLCEVSNVFEPDHPELNEGLIIAGNLIIQAQNVLKQFYEVAWGEPPTNWTATRERK